MYGAGWRKRGIPMVKGNAAGSLAHFAQEYSIVSVVDILVEFDYECAVGQIGGIQNYGGSRIYYGHCQV